MHETFRPWQAVLTAYPEAYRPVQITALDSAGGFSGATLWQLRNAEGQTYCLRAWPAGWPPRQRLEFAHRVLRHVWRQGFCKVPVPIAAHHGETLTEHTGRLWQLEPWMPGTADYWLRPTTAKLQSALGALAEFHLAAETAAPAGAAQPSPGLLHRRDQLRQLLAGGLERLRSAVTLGDWPQFYDRACRLLDRFPSAAPAVSAELERAASLALTLQPVIRDVWHDHILFRENEVSGIIDFGGLQWDSVAADLARLLGSFAGNEDAAWRIGLAAYEACRPITAVERSLLEVFHCSNVVLGGMVWLRWYYLEGRRFSQPQVVLDRLDRLLTLHPRLPPRGYSFRFSRSRSGPFGSS